MKVCKKTWAVMILLALCSPVFAQEGSEDLDEKMREAERRLVETEREMADACGKPRRRWPKQLSR
jgi:hypothetical protein